MLFAASGRCVSFMSLITSSQKRIRETVLDNLALTWFDSNCFNGADIASIDYKCNNKMGVLIGVVQYFALNFALLN